MMKRIKDMVSDAVSYLTSHPLDVLIVMGVVAFAGSYSNLEWLKANAPAKWKAQGFEVVDYEGFQWGAGGYGTPYGGAKVWHRLRKIPDNGITYSGYVKRWGNEVHVYGPKAIDAIQP